MIRLHTVIGIAALLWVNALVAAAPTQPARPVAQKVTEVEGITEYRLPNGLRVLLFPDPSKPTIVVNVTYLVGSRQENYGETGMAHLLEHMLFKGTPNHPDIARDFNSRGMRFNGSTSLDRTNYFELFQANDDNLDWALAMEADRMVHSFVARKDLDTEMTVVRNEYERGENAPTAVLIKRLQSIAYDWHNYGHSTIGNRSDIENVEIGNLQAFYRLYYQPDNAVLLVAGKFDTSKALELVTRYFGAIPRPSRALPKLWTVEPTQDGERSFVVRRVGDVEVVALGYKVPSALHPDDEALNFAALALTDTPSGRLHKALVETGKAVQVGSFRLNGVDGSLQVIVAVLKKGDPIEPVQAEMIRQVESFQDNPPTEQEMERARLRFANDAERVLDDHENIGLRLSEFIALGDWRMFFLSRDRAQKMTAADVQAAAGHYFRRDNRTLGVFLHDDKPQRAEIPKVASAAEMLKDYEAKATTSTAEAFDPTPDNIDQRTKHLDIEGMKVALLQKKNRGETVFVALELPSGDEKSLFGKNATAVLTGQMLMRGTSRYTREQLRDELTKLKVNGGVNGRAASFETTRSNLAAAIHLTAHVLREPSFPEAEFSQLQKQILTAIESELSQPEARAGSALAQHFNIYPKGDVRYEESLEESLEEYKAVSLNDIRQYHKTFYGADRAQIAIVGDFDEAEVVKALTESFAGWHSGSPYTRVTREFKNVDPANNSIETPDKENAIFLARLNVDIDDADADYPALFVANYILGGGAGFDSRLVQRIRVKEGLSYNVGSSLSPGRFDRAGVWTARAIAAPQNIGKVESTFRDELSRLLKDGITAAELAKAKSGIAQQEAQTRAQDRALVGKLRFDIDADRTLAWDKQFEAHVAALTPAAVTAAARKYIDPSRITVVKAGDFAKGAGGNAKP
ncbi:MAG TPA: pitrilysin family protein [Steroidobacteraceae bacterium]